MKCWPWNHKFEECGRQHMQAAAYHPLYGYVQGHPPTDWTVVTERCSRCGKYQQQKLHGMVDAALEATESRRGKA